MNRFSHIAVFDFLKISSSLLPPPPHAHFGGEILQKKNPTVIFQENVEKIANFFARQVTILAQKRLILASITTVEEDNSLENVSDISRHLYFEIY